MIFNSEKLSKVCINQNVRSIIWISKSFHDFNDLQNTVVYGTRPGDFLSLHVLLRCHKSYGRRPASVFETSVYPQLVCNTCRIAYLIGPICHHDMPKTNGNSIHIQIEEHVDFVEAPYYLFHNKAELEFK